MSVVEKGDSVEKTRKSKKNESTYEHEGEKRRYVLDSTAQW